MLELRPSCENCDKPLPNGSTEAMICSFECTFCADCVTNVLLNVCPNCGGGLEKRPTRPTRCATENCIQNYPAGTIKKLRTADPGKLTELIRIFGHLPPNER